MEKEKCENCKYFEGSQFIFGFPTISCKNSKRVKVLKSSIKRPAWKYYYCGGFVPKKIKIPNNK